MTELKDSSGLVAVAGTTRKSREADVIFIHGLIGGSQTTWAAEEKPENFWPAWLAEEFSNIGIWTLGYHTTVSAWRERSMPLADLGIQILEELHAQGIGSRPILFITHSMGGLVAKQILSHAKSQGVERYEKIADNTRGIAFLATPHSGANLANFAEFVEIVFRTTEQVTDLKKHSSRLSELHGSFLKFVKDQELVCRSYAERREVKPGKTIFGKKITIPKGILVVDATSAEPNIPGERAIPLDEDHISICKPNDKTKPIYTSIQAFIRKCLQNDSVSEEFELTFPEKFNLFTDEDQNAILQAIGNILRTNRTILVKSRSEGSVVITIELTENEAERLMAALDRGALQEYDLVKAVWRDRTFERKHEPTATVDNKEKADPEINQTKKDGLQSPDELEGKMNNQEVDRKTEQASVVFIHLPGLFELESGLCFDAIQELHNKLRNTPFPNGVRVLSAFTGAIIVAPDRVFNEAKPGQASAMHHFFKAFFTECKKGGMPVRVGVTHGRVEFFTDVEFGTYIGECVNIAARVATAPENSGLLYHESYSESFKVVPDQDLLRANMNATPVFASGKEHDGQGFRCFPAMEDPSVCSDNRDFGGLGHSVDSQVSGLIVAVDLPSFSSGAHDVLSKRFRAFVDAVAKVRAELEINEIYYSPGGDGGVFVFPGVEPGGKARTILNSFSVFLSDESELQVDNACVESRIGVNYGQVPIYCNASNQLMPTGHVCFTADQIAKDITDGSIACTSIFEKEGGGHFKPEEDAQLVDSVDVPGVGLVGRFLLRGELKQKPVTGNEYMNDSQSREEFKSASNWISTFPINLMIMTSPLRLHG